MGLWETGIYSDIAKRLHGKIWKQNKADSSDQPLTVVPHWGIRPKQINAKEKIA